MELGKPSESEEVVIGVCHREKTLPHRRGEELQMYSSTLKERALHQLEKSLDSMASLPKIPQQLHPKPSPNLITKAVTRDGHRQPDTNATHSRPAGAIRLREVKLGA